jgi:alpha-1,2-glucosyltransferase
MSLFSNLPAARMQRPFWIFFYLVATFGVLVPAPLIEFRYFNVPFFLTALHVPMPLRRRRPTLLLQISLFAAVDIGAIFLFLRRTFRWPLEDSTQRFMW